MHNVHKGAALALVGAALAYATWVISPWLVPELSVVESYASELAADGLGHAEIFRWGDRIASVLLLIAAALLRGPRITWLRALLAVWASATLIDSFFRMSCAQSLDTRCVLRQSTFPTVQDTIHVLSSSTATIASVLAVAAGTWLRPAARSTRVMAWICVGATILVIIASGAAEIFHVNAGLALVQRLQLATLSAWLIAFGRQLWTSWSTLQASAGPPLTCSR